MKLLQDFQLVNGNKISDEIEMYILFLQSYQEIFD